MGDKSFIDQVKADILRRAAELSDSEEEEVEIDEYGKKVRIAAFEEEDDELDNNIKVAGDGEATSDDEDADPIEEVRSPLFCCFLCVSDWNHYSHRPLLTLSLSLHISTIRKSLIEIRILEDQRRGQI